MSAREGGVEQQAADVVARVDALDRIARRVLHLGAVEDVGDLFGQRDEQIRIAGQDRGVELAIGFRDFEYLAALYRLLGNVRLLTSASRSSSKWRRPG